MVFSFLLKRDRLFKDEANSYLAEWISLEEVHPPDMQTWIHVVRLFL